MGGSRCYFRNCKVSTVRNPGMHFFRFPIHNDKRLNDWIHFSGLEDYRKLPESQQRNKVICGRHFHTACFMNYKQDKLILTAVPTITRLNFEWALDYEQDLQNPKIINIAVTSLNHLIPPSGFKDPQCFNGDDLKFGAYVLELHEGKTNCNEIIEIPEHKRFKVAEEQAIVEVIAEDFFDSLTSDEPTSEQFKVDCPSDAEKTVDEQSNKSKECGNCLNKRIQELEAILESKNDELCSMKAKLEKQNNDLSGSQKRIKLLVDGCNEMKLRLASQSNLNQQLTIEINDLKLKYKQAQHSHNELEKQHAELKARLEKEMAVAVSKSETPESQREVNQPQHLSKLQLFNGIKRYLSQTMIALLRMQLSPSGMERVWRPDEKRVATDLLGLGEQVYKYFTDEWLIRLPGINLVSDWRNQIESEDDEDEL